MPSHAWQGTHMAGDGYVAAIAKRLGEDRFFSEAFGVFTTYLLFFVYFVWRYSEFSYICKRMGWYHHCSP